MRIFTSMLIILSITFLDTGVAMPPPVITYKDVEVSGVVSFAGKPVADIPIELSSNFCDFAGPDIYSFSFDKEKRITKTDKDGRYHFFFTGISNRALSILVNGYGTKQKTKMYASGCEDDKIDFGDNKKTTINFALDKISALEKTCDAKGGTYVYSINYDTKKKEAVCKIYFPDAEKSCTDGSQCQSEICEGEYGDNNKIIGECAGVIDMVTGKNMEVTLYTIKNGKMYDGNGVLQTEPPKNCADICKDFSDAKSVGSGELNCATVPEQNKVLWELPW